MLQTLSSPVFYVVFALLQSCVFLLVIRLMDLYEREPFFLIALMAVWGAVFANAISIIGNEAVLAMLPPTIREVFGPAISAPIVEEIAKGSALVIACVLSWFVGKRFGIFEFEGVTDGLVYGAAVGLGFAFTEDILYMLNTAAGQNVLSGLQLYLQRVDFFGISQLGHAVYTGIFGAGLGLATWSRTWRGRFGFPVLALFAAMAMHAVNNGFVALVLTGRFGIETTADVFSGMPISSEIYDSVALTSNIAGFVELASEYLFLILFVTVVVIWLRFQKGIIRDELAEEVECGTVSSEDFRGAYSVRSRVVDLLKLVLSGRFEEYRLSCRIQKEIIELALLKWRVSRLGADSRRVESHRRRIAALNDLEAREKEISLREDAGGIRS